MFGMFEFTEDTGDLLLPQIRRSLATPATLSWGRNEIPDHHVISGSGASSKTCIVAVLVFKDENSTGAILLFLDSDVNSANIENVEIFADEIANAQILQRLDRERSEYVNTPLAMNSISSILNDAGTRG